MIFHEIYGCYYQAVAKMLHLALNGSLTEKAMKQICDETAFSESFLEIIPAIKEQRWQLIDADRRTPLQHEPDMPLTLLEKRWLKAISLDPRFRLFGVELPELGDVEPLFTPDDYVVFDRYADGDPYENPDYIRNFRTVLTAIHEGRSLDVRYRNRNGKPVRFRCVPQFLEYSEKDDKFRVIRSAEEIRAFNLSRIVSCEMGERECVRRIPYRSEQKTILFDLTDDRNTLERAMLHFAHFEKQIEKTDDTLYRVTLQYDPSDETELLIRILGFGPMLHVVAPESFADLIRDRLTRQRNLLQ